MALTLAVNTSACCRLRVKKAVTFTWSGLCIWLAVDLYSLTLGKVDERVYIEKGALLYMCSKINRSENVWAMASHQAFAETHQTTCQ